MSTEVFYQYKVIYKLIFVQEYKKKLQNLIRN